MLLEQKDIFFHSCFNWWQIQMEELLVWKNTNKFNQVFQSLLSNFATSFLILMNNNKLNYLIFLYL